MSIIEILVIVLSCLFVASVIAVTVYRKVKGKGGSGCCSKNCANCVKNCSGENIKKHDVHMDK